MNEAKEHFGPEELWIHIISVIQLLQSLKLLFIIFQQLKESVIKISITTLRLIKNYQT